MKFATIKVKKGSRQKVANLRIFSNKNFKFQMRKG